MSSHMDAINKIYDIFLSSKTVTNLLPKKLNPGLSALVDDANMVNRCIYFVKNGKLEDAQKYLTQMVGKIAPDEKKVVERYLKDIIRGVTRLHRQEIEKKYKKKWIITSFGIILVGVAFLVFLSKKYAGTYNVFKGLKDILTKGNNKLRAIVVATLILVIAAILLAKRYFKGKALEEFKEFRKLVAKYRPIQRSKLV